MTVVNIYDAKTRLSKLIEEAAAGNDVVIARGGKPVARLTRLGSSKRKLKFGVLKGKDQGLGGLRCAAAKRGLKAI